MNKRTVIVSGGMLEEDFVLDIVKDRQTECIIGVDRGLLFLYEHKILPDYIVGDLDSVPEAVISYYRKETKIPIREYNPQKDASDTEIALRLCLERGCQHLIILGGIGTRLDHGLANIQSLKLALDAGIEAWLMDSHNRIRLLKERFRLTKEKAFGPYFSVFPLGASIEDFNIKGAKYPLTNHLLTPYDSLCVSNEFATDEIEISFPYGIVIFMETKD